MKTANIIKASAQVITITELSSNDVYKRVQDDKIRYGVVVDVLNNGEDSAIQAIEYLEGWNGLDIEEKVFQGGKDIAIFACTTQEVLEFINRVKENIANRISDKKEELNRLYIKEKLLFSRTEMMNLEKINPAKVEIKE